MTQSNAVAEYWVMGSTISELIWVKHLLKDMDIETYQPMKMFVIIFRVTHSIKLFHEQTKHIEVDCQYVQEKVQAKEIKTVC